MGSQIIETGAVLERKTDVHHFGNSQAKPRFPKNKPSGLKLRMRPQPSLFGPDGKRNPTGMLIVKRAVCRRSISFISSLQVASRFRAATATPCAARRPLPPTDDQTRRQSPTEELLPEENFSAHTDLPTRAPFSFRTNFAARNGVPPTIHSVFLPSHPIPAGDGMIDFMVSITRKSVPCLYSNPVCPSEDHRSSPSHASPVGLGPGAATVCTVGNPTAR